MTTPPHAPVPGGGSGTVEELLAEEFPRMLMVQTTSACNSACVFCPHRSVRKTLPQGEISDMLFRKIILEASDHPQVSCINLFLMNEPLVDPSLVDRITMAKAHNPQAQISLFTNGVALDAAMTDRLLDSPLDSLGVSLHAHSPETYRRVTGRRDFYRILRNLVRFVERRLVRRPDLSLTLRFVGAGQMMEAGEVDRLIDFWSDGGVELDIGDGYLSRAGNLPAPGAVARPHRRLAGCRALGGPKQAHILYTGQVVLCCMDYRRLTSLGDCTKENLAQIWTGPRRRAALEMLYGLTPVDPGAICCRCELAIPGGEEEGPSPA